MLLNDKKIVIAIDGYSSCGKSTFAKAIAKKMNYLYLDSGAMYRAVTVAALRNNLINNKTLNEVKLEHLISQFVINFKYNQELDRYETFLNGENVEEEIRGIKVSENVSLISTFRFVREKLVKIQQKMGKDKGIVMDGRDIGTVVFPDAELKIFMTADPLIRAQRRFKELNEKGISTSIEEIFENIKQRDNIDENREVSPLSKANDALLLDNSFLTPDQQMNWVMEKIDKL